MLRKKLIRYFVPDKSQLRVLSAVYVNFSAVFLATMVLSPLFVPIDKIDWKVLILGLGFTLFSVFMALITGKKGKL